ncbi:putative uncharacterized protein [Pseudomonas sp. StFLB209]|uniref:DUF6708 domain-containing protein n=1 Tax=Pseudomonas sp. StFLB209 TaxID=1028989 RepID=UPI0004F89438|nr:DUF6708 domain-containing protein [Pseudomonas sp. StFLB209]BAP43607.1 putative uncharacterized protein [Pseudomonas sp. StFLB209]
MTTDNKYDRLPRAGDTEHEPDQQVFYLAPLPLPTGVKPFSCRELQKNANETYMDFMLGKASFELSIRFFIGSVLGMSLFLFLIGFSLGLYAFVNFDRPFFEGLDILLFDGYFTPAYLIGIFLITGLPILHAIWVLSRIPPIRFNRQRREVAYVAKRGDKPCIIPWESVIACLSSRLVPSKYGTQQSHELLLCLRNSEATQQMWVNIACYSPAFAIAEWEAIRVYMEEGPEALPGRFIDPKYEEGTVEYFELCRYVYRRDHNYLVYLLGFVLIQGVSGWHLPCRLAAWINGLPRKSLPREVAQWSKPLPPEQWQQPGAELLEQSKEVHKVLHRGKTLVDYFKELSAPPETKSKKSSSKKSRKKQITIVLAPDYLPQDSREKPINDNR